MIYICIPTHNEQQTVGVVLWKLRQVLTEFPRDYQLLVADDASTDKTTDVLEPYTRVLPLTVIRSERRQGHAASLEMLLREAVRRSEYPKRDVVVTLQADFSEEPDDVVDLIKRMEAGADVAIGVKVSRTPHSRMRRLARSLSRFFTRKQTWPEGVVEPFDGYRAYRLHAVKRAMEDRGAGRLIRYDGWAGQAELLRAVLPHSRRIETIEVDDRCDRLQRPRRERPIAAALQVRAMASGAEPAGLLSTEELDRTAATASRSRDRARPGLNGDPRARANGAASRDRRPSQDARSGGGRADRGRDAGRGRDATRGEGRPRPAAGAAGGERNSDRGREGGRTGRSERMPATGRARGSDQGQDPRRRSGRAAGAAGAAGAGAASAAGAETATDAATGATVAGAAATPSPERRSRRGARAQAEGPQTSAADDLGLLQGASADDGDPAAAAEGDVPRPKKKRRRRRSKGGAGAGADAPQDSVGADAPQDSVGAASSPDAAAPDAAQVADGEGDEADDGGGEGGERKRRRRGGRRGGRGRRRGPRAEGAEDAGEDASAPEAGGVAGSEGGDGAVERERSTTRGDIEEGSGVTGGESRERPTERPDAAAASAAESRVDEN